MAHQSSNSYRSRSPAEWVSFCVALFILGILIALICYSWVTGKDDPPVLAVNITADIRQVDNQYYVPFSVTNEGGRTAEAVEVVAELEIDGEVTQEGIQLIDFLSGGEVQSGAFVFTTNPDAGNLSIRAASYKLP